MLLCCFRSWGSFYSGAGSKGLLCIPLISESHCAPHLLQWKNSSFQALCPWLFERKVFWESEFWPSGPRAECFSQDVYIPWSPRSLDTKVGRRLWNARIWELREAHCFQFGEGDSLQEWWSPLFHCQDLHSRYLLNNMTLQSTREYWFV